ncbi:phosphatase PAP2 family protein [candidate division KSB1 bacterium]|nr:phosphatase PAP2 family protein [candidate division KSB1 bacterium]
MRNSITVLIILASTCMLPAPPALAQLRQQQKISIPATAVDHFTANETQNAPFYKNLIAGARASVNTWQLPVFAASLLTERQKAGRGLPMPPLAFDHEIAEDWSRRDGRASLGSLSPGYYQALAVRARLAGMVLLDALTGHDYSPSSYAKLFRFQQAFYFNTVVTHLAKRNFNRYRPDGSDTQSFFSGHTSTVFTASTFLYLETRDFIDGQVRQGRDLPLLSPTQWKAVSFSVAYGWAAYVGFSRIHDNKHYLSDVLVGAVSGTLVSYLLYPHPEKNALSSKFMFEVLPRRRGPSMGVRYSF